LAVVGTGRRRAAVISVDFDSGKPSKPSLMHEAVDSRSTSKASPSRRHPASSKFCERPWCALQRGSPERSLLEAQCHGQTRPP
jgi:hypothetical protein